MFKTYQTYIWLYKKPDHRIVETCLKIEFSRKAPASSILNRYSYPTH